MSSNTVQPSSRFLRYLVLVIVFPVCIFFTADYVLNKSGLFGATDTARWPVSCFVFRDDNLNGIYDTADRPYAGLAVDLTRPDGSIVNSVSNIAGFANFEAGRGTASSSDFYTVGEYGVEAYPVDGWRITSDMTPNHLITTTADDKVVGRLKLDEPCRHIGVGADLTVSGSVTDLEFEVRLVEIFDGETKISESSPDESGNFSLEISPGEWEVVLSGQDAQKRIAKSIEVVSKSLFLSHAFLSADTPMSKVGNEVIGFDDVTSSETLYELPFGYSDLDWLYWIATHNKFYQGYGYVNGAISGEYIAYNSSGFPASFSSKESFDFVGANVTAAWPQGAEDVVVVHAWREDQLVYTDYLQISPAGPVYFLADYRNVHKVEFMLPNHERIVLDDLAVRR